MCRAGVTGLPIEEVASEEAALRRHCGSSVWTRRVHLLARRRAGALARQPDRERLCLINDLIVPTADPRMPFGGVKASGFGVTRGEEGLLEMTFPHVVAVRHGRSRPHFDELRAEDDGFFPPTSQAAHGRGPQRLSAMRDLYRALLARTRIRKTS